MSPRRDSNHVRFQSHLLSLALALALIIPTAAAAAEAPAAGGDDAQSLAMKLSNPVADMVSIPFQYNWVSGIGPQQDMRYVLNIQPVVPFSISPKWNLIARWIMPYVSQPASLGSSSGFSDIVASAFFSPADSQGLTWGVGPVVSLPTTTDPTLGSGKWSAGPTIVVLKQQGKWTYGMLANQLWSYGDVSTIDRAEVSQAFVQPFFAYSTTSSVTYTLQSESTANWLATRESDTWTVPINFLVSKITKLGPFPMSVTGGGGVYVQKPDGGPDWQLRTAFILILPRGK